MDAKQRKILVFGATGTIGRATVKAALAAGHHVTCAVRPASGGTALAELTGATLRYGAVDDIDVWEGAPFDTVISCLASRTGAPDDAWAVDCDANKAVFAAAQEHGVPHVILLSAICVQKPRLAFQHAKLAAEKALIDSGLDYTIVRPTAFFKSLSGQIARVRQGKRFLVFGDGKLTACKPISDRDMGRFLVQCVTDEARRNQILPIGGPGPAITPREQAEHLFSLLDQKPKIKRVPLALMRTIAGGLGLVSRVAPSLKAKAEFARIGLYYASESMLVWDGTKGAYDADYTPSFGEDTLFDYYAEVIAGRATVESGDHSVF